MPIRQEKIIAFSLLPVVGVLTDYIFRLMRTPIEEGKIIEPNKYPNGIIY